MIQANPYTFNDGCCFIQYDPTNLKFMRFDIAKECMWVTTKNPVEDAITILKRGATPKAPFFYSGSDLFYNKCTKEVFLKCEEDWYQVNFANEKYFVLNNNLSMTSSQPSN